MTTRETISEADLATYRGKHLQVTEGGVGWFAVIVWWNPDMGGFWEPWDSGQGRYETEDEARVEAVALAKTYGYPYLLPAPPRAAVAAPPEVDRAPRPPVPPTTCIGCGLAPEAIDEYRELAAVEGMTAAALAAADGTYNAATGQFCCTTCYVQRGSPSRSFPRRWVAGDPEGAL